MCKNFRHLPLIRSGRGTPAGVTGAATGPRHLLQQSRYLRQKQLPRRGFAVNRRYSTSSIGMTRRKVHAWVFGFGAAAIVLLQRTDILHAQTSGPRPAADPRAAAQAANPGGAAGVLEGTVTLTCKPGTVGCVDRPYHVGLFVQGERTGTPPIQVYASPQFSLRLAPGSYTISSADARGACCLPILRPISVMIRAGGLTRVEVRFEPGLELPARGH
jgi:hypothetical protein